MKKKNTLTKTIGEDLGNYGDQIANVIRQKQVYTRVFAVLALLFALVGFWWPFTQMNTSLSFKGPFGGELMVLPDDTPVITVRASDFLTGKKLSQFEVFGKQIGDYKIGNYPILQILQNPLQNYGYLDTAAQLINPQTAALISSPQVETALTQYFPDYANDIKNILQGTANLVSQASPIVTSLNNLMIATRQESLAVSEQITAVEKDLQIANLIAVVTFVFIIAAIILLCWPQVQRWLLLLVIGVPTAIMSTVAIYLSWLNRQLVGWNTTFVANINNNLQQAVIDIVNQLLGDNAVLFSQWTSQQVNYLNWHLNFQWQTGSLLMLAGLLGAFIITFLVPNAKVKRSGKKR